MPTRSLRIEPLAGYTPTIGRLVGILQYARYTTLAAVEGMSETELDHLQDASGNSIGALLAHIAVVERGYQLLTFEDRAASALERAAWEPALTLGAEARRLLRGQPLEHYVHELNEVRRLTLEGLAARDDAWLEQSLRTAPAMNAHWGWFHVAEEEINHRGQIRWLRARMKTATETPIDIAQTIIGMERAALERWGRGDPSGFLEISADDVVYFDPFQERRLNGIAELRALYESIRGQVQIAHFELIDPVVQAADNMAVLTFNHVAAGADGVTSRWNCTEVFRRDAGTWRIVQTHWSFTQPDSHTAPAGT